MKPANSRKLDNYSAIHLDLPPSLHQTRSQSWSTSVCRTPKFLRCKIQYNRNFKQRSMRLQKRGAENIIWTKRWNVQQNKCPTSTLHPVVFVFDLNNLQTMIKFVKQAIPILPKRPVCIEHLNIHDGHCTSVKHCSIWTSSRESKHTSNPYYFKARQNRKKKPHR